LNNIYIIYFLPVDTLPRTFVLKKITQVLIILKSDYAWFLCISWPNTSLKNHLKGNKGFRENKNKCLLTFVKPKLSTTEEISKTVFKTEKT